MVVWFGIALVSKYFIFGTGFYCIVLYSMVGL
jgi:hypothetical protein